MYDLFRFSQHHGVALSEGQQSNLCNCTSHSTRVLISYPKNVFCVYISIPIDVIFVQYRIIMIVKDVINLKKRYGGATSREQFWTLFKVQK